MKGITDFSQAFHMQMLFLTEKRSVKTVIFLDQPNLGISTCSGSTKVLFISDLRQDGFFKLWVMIVAMNNHIISQIIHAFWLVFTHNLLEDRLIKMTASLTTFCPFLSSQICFFDKKSQNVVTTLVTHLTALHVPLHCSYKSLSSSVTLIITVWTDPQQHGIYLLTL